MTTQVPPKRNAAFTFELAVFDYSGKLLTAATFSSKQISQDGGTFATITNAPAEIGSSGTYTIDLTATEMDADRVALRFVIASAPDIVINLFTVARQIDDLAYPATSGRSTDIDSSGRVLLQPTQSGVTIPTVTTLTDAPADSATLTAIKTQTDLLPSDPADESALEAAITAAQSAITAQTDIIKAKTNLIPASPAAVGSQMDLVNAPNATAITAIQSGLATSANVTTILNRLGAWTGSGRNSILGALQSVFRKDSDASVPSDINADLGGGAGAASNLTDSLEAIRDRGDAAWTGGGGGLTASDIADEVETRTIAAVTTVGSVSGSVASVAGDVGGNVVGNIGGTVPDSAGVTTLLTRLTSTRAEYLDVLAGFSGTLLGLVRAMLRKDASSADIAGTYDPTTDSQEATREKIDTLLSNPPLVQTETINELND